MQLNNTLLPRFKHQLMIEQTLPEMTEVFSEHELADNLFLVKLKYPEKGEPEIMFCDPANFATLSKQRAVESFLCVSAGVLTWYLKAGQQRLI